MSAGKRSPASPLPPPFSHYVIRPGGGSHFVVPACRFLPGPGTSPDDHGKAARPCPKYHFAPHQVPAGCPDFSRLVDDPVVALLLEDLWQRRQKLEAALRRHRKPHDPELDAKLLRLREVEGLTFGEIAQRLGPGPDGERMTANAARKAYRRAVARRDGPARGH